MGKSPEFLHVNRLWFFASIALIAIGLILMYTDPAEYGFGTMGLTVGAIICLAGFLVPVVAIMSTTGHNKSQEQA